MATDDALLSNATRRDPCTATRCVALGAVVLSCSHPLSERYLPWECNDAVIALVALTAVLVLEDGQLPGLGLRRAPELGWWHWCRLALRFSFWIGVALVVSTGAVWLSGWKVPIYRFPLSNLTERLFMMCVYAPIVEEVIYRSLLRVAVEPALGWTGTIVVSGVIFGLVHILRGNASPENQIAGFLLAWTFLRSGTILVPLAMHSAGNSIALMSQIANWYLIPERWL